MCWVTLLRAVCLLRMFCSSRNDELASRQDGKSCKEVACGERFSASSLEFGDSEMILAAGDYDAARRSFNNGSGFSFGSGLGFGPPKFDSGEFNVFSQAAEGSGPGIESAYLIGEFERRSMPINFAVAPVEFASVSGPLMVLWANRYVAFEIF